MSGTWLVLSFVTIVFLAGCDRGLEPPPSPPLISGKIFFEGKNPSCDSVRILAVVLIEAPPPYRKEDLIAGFIGGAVLPFVLDTCSFRDTTYRFTVTAGKRYGYLGVAQNYDTNLYNDWRVAGFSHDEYDSATSFVLAPGEILDGVDVHVRFDSLPRQPFVQ